MPEIIPSPINPTGEPERDRNKLLAEREKLAERLRWLIRLCENGDLAEFFAVARRRLAVTRTLASDIERCDAAKRDAYAQCHFELRTFVEWPEEQRAADEARLGQLDEELRTV